MAKKIRRLFALGLALCLVLSVAPLQALALDTTETTTETTTEGGITTTIETTTTTSTDETGKTTLIVDIQSSGTGTLEDGTEVTVSETKTVESMLDEDGNLIAYSETVDGMEETVWEGDLTPDDTELPKVELDLTFGGTATGTATGTESIETDHIEDGSTPANSDTTTTTTVIEREASATLSEVTTESEQFSDTEMEAIGPEDYEGKTNIGLYSGTDPMKAGNGIVPYYTVCYDQYEVLDENGNVVETRFYPITERKPAEYDVLPDEIKAKYAFDETDGLYKAIDPADGYYAMSNGVWWDYVLDGHTEESTSGQAIANNNWHDNSLFVLYDKAGNRAYAYCMDAVIGTGNSVRYSVENLEDADYFTGTEEEQADAKAHVRAIALNGYWGTEEGTGSLANLKSGLVEALDNGLEVEFSFQNGSGIWYYTSGTDTSGWSAERLAAAEEITREELYALASAINEGDALVATQGSFWSYGRENNNWLGFNPYRSNSPDGMLNGGAEARMTLIQIFLTSDYLSEKVAKESSGTTIINDGTFLEKDGISIAIGDKVDTEANYDEQDDNDVYYVDISFTMVVEPSTENGDDLIITLLDSEGNIVRKARLAGDNTSDDESFSAIVKNGSTYTFPDLALAENSELMFDLQLNGWQNLEEGVYMYKATAGYDRNQTLVGLSGGEKEVDVSSTFSLVFEVDESKKITTEHVWHSEYDPEIELPEEEEEPEDEIIVPVEEEEVPPAPVFEVNVEEDDVIEIPDEEVPLADAPKTGSDAIIWIALALFAAMGMAATRFINTKKHKTF